MGTEWTLAVVGASPGVAWGGPIARHSGVRGFAFPTPGSLPFLVIVTGTSGLRLGPRCWPMLTRHDPGAGTEGRHQPPVTLSK